MDFLTDSISSPTVLFLNSKITEDGIIPDMGYLSSGNHSEEVVLFDKNGYKVCKIKLT